MHSLYQTCPESLGLWNGQELNLFNRYRPPRRIRLGPFHVRNVIKDPLHFLYSSGPDPKPLGGKITSTL